MNEAYTTLGRIWADLKDADMCLARERLSLVSAWLQADTTTKTAWGWAEVATTESRKEAVDAKAARDTTLIEAAAAVKRCSKVEASMMKALQVEQAAHAQQLSQR